MTIDTRVKMHKGAAALIAIALLAAGAGATYLLMRNDAGTGRTAAEVSPHGARPAPPGTSNSPLLSDRSTQSGCRGARWIIVARSMSGMSGRILRLPEVVEPMPIVRWW